MHLTWLVAGALIPREFADAVTSSTALPALAARLAHARYVDDGKASSNNYSAHLDWIARHLFGQPSPAPTAPYAYAFLSGSQPTQSIYHADLVHIEVARDSLLVQSLDGALPTADEGKQLFEVANELASHLGRFVQERDHWFLRSDRDWNIETSPLAQALDAPLVLPGGADTPTWHRLHNEIQMSWHTHAVNEAREASGQPTINGIWLHGGGRWKPLPPIAYREVAADAPELRGAAEAAQSHAAPLTAVPADRSLRVIDRALYARRNHDWSAWSEAMIAADRQLADRSNDAIDLVLTASTVRTFQLRPSDRFKVWRRRSLTEALAE